MDPLSVLLPILFISLTMNALDWWKSKLRRKRKEQKAAAKAQRKAEKELKKQKDSVRGRLQEQRDPEQVRGRAQEPRPTPERQRAQKEAAQKDPKATEELLDDFDKSVEKSPRQPLSSAWSSSSSLQVLVKQQQELWAPGNEALMAKMSAQETAQNTTSLKAVSSSSSSSVWEQVAKSRLMKASTQDLTAVQESSAAVFPVRGVRSASSMGCDAKKPFQSSQEWKEPGKEQGQARVQGEEPGKEQSQDRSKQPQAVPVAPAARQPGPQARAQRLRSVGQKLRRRLARIWLRLCSCCPCLQRWARKKQGVP